MNHFAWRPTSEHLENSRVARFMRQHGIDDPAALRRRSAADPEWFYPAIIDDLGIKFDQSFEKVVDTSAGAAFAEWFTGGRLNLVANCLHRHRSGPIADEPCLVGLHETDGDGTSAVRYTFRQLAAEVDRCAVALQRAGIEPGDRVAAYMPMISDVVVQMLATIQVGAVFVPVFSGYAPAALAERVQDAEAKLLFVADRSSRRGKPVAILPNARAALSTCPSVETMVVVVRGLPGDPEAELDEGRDVTWSEFLASGSGAALEKPTMAPMAEMSSMDPALILYTSGTTGRPKGTVHSHAGTLIQLAKEVGYAFDVHGPSPDEGRAGDRFFWFTDIGWMMGPWAIIGGLFHGATVYLYEGAIDYPEPDALWALLEEHKISVFGISPTAIRMLLGLGTEAIEKRDLSALRILGSTGEPWDPESWQWYFQHVGGERCPVINISGGTDIIGCFLSPLPVDPIKPCSLVGPGLGMAVEVWNEEGEAVEGEVGYLVATKPAPSMTRGLWRDRDRYLAAYWSRWPEVWNHGDWAIIDDDGQWFLQGRSDDTLKVAGRRIGPAELEGALIETGHVLEAAAVGVPHDIKGTGIVCFVVLGPGVERTDELARELEQAVVDRLGKVDRPERIEFVPDLPKTRSAKILRRMVRAVYLGEEPGDLASVQNPEALDGIPRA